MEESEIHFQQPPNDPRFPITAACCARWQVGEIENNTALDPADGGTGRSRSFERRFFPGKSDSNGAGSRTLRSIAIHITPHCRPGRSIHALTPSFPDRNLLLQFKGKINPDHFTRNEQFIHEKSFSCCLTYERVFII